MRRGITKNLEKSGTKGENEIKPEEIDSIRPQKTAPSMLIKMN
jgi:hypothetical protein